MENEIPKVDFNSTNPLEVNTSDIEVLNFSELYERVTSKLDHNPFSSHRIGFYLILFVTKGEYSHFVDFEAHAMKEGSIIFVAKNQVHHFTSNLKDAKGYVIAVNSEFLERNFIASRNLKHYRLYNYHIESPIIHREVMGQDDFKEIISRIYFEYHFPNSLAKDEILRHMLHLIFLKAERIKQNKSNEESNQKWVENFTKFKNSLEKNYVSYRNSRQYASELNISYKLLNEITKSFRGKTTKAFIDDFVTTEIKRYLASTSNSVKEISYMTGFDEPGNMSKFFKKNASVTPLQFRNSNS